MSRAVQNSIAIARIDREWRIEVLSGIGDSGCLRNPCCAAIIGAPEETTRTVAIDWSLVIHAEGVGFTEFDQAAISALEQRPAQAARVFRDAIVLTSAQCDVGVCGVEGDSVELNCIQIAIELSPGKGCRVVEAVDSPVIAVEILAISVKRGGMMIDMRPAGRETNVRKSHSTVHRSEHDGGAGRVDNP